MFSRFLAAASAVDLLISPPSGSLSGSKHGLQDCGDVYGDRLLCAVCVGLDPGLFYHAH